MRILGIDPGIARTGYGIIDVVASNLKVVSYGCIETSLSLSLDKRLESLYSQLEKIISDDKPEAVGIEDLFFNTNAKTAIIVGQARGVALLASARSKMPVSVYTPLQVKMALTGYGRAEKNQVGQMVKVLLKLKEVPKPDDTADALAIAITHAFSYKLNAKK